MAKIIRSCFCQVNNRSEKEILGMNIEYLYFKSVLQREQEIASRLDYDLYVPLIENQWLSPALSMSHSKNSNVQEVESAIQTVSQWKSLYDQAVSLLITLFSSQSSQFLLFPFPSEHLQLAMMLIVIGLEITMEFSTSSGQSQGQVHYRTPPESDVLFTFPPIPTTGALNNHVPNKHGMIVYAGLHELLADRQQYWDLLTEIAAMKLHLSYAELAFLIRYLLKLMAFHIHLMVPANKAFQSLNLSTGSITSQMPGPQMLSNKDVLDDMDLMFHILELATVSGVFHNYLSHTYPMDVIKPPSGNAQSARPLKTRLNPLFFPSSSSVLIDVNALNQELLIVDEDCYQGHFNSQVLSNLGLSHWLLKPTKGDKEHVMEVDEDEINQRGRDGIPFSMRSFPNSRTSHKEVVKMQHALTAIMSSSSANTASSLGAASSSTLTDTVDHAGMLQSQLLEMHLFQQLHYFHRPSIGTTDQMKIQRKEMVTSPFFMEPVVFGQIDAWSLSQELITLKQLSSSSSSGKKSLSIQDPFLKHMLFLHELFPLSYLLETNNQYTSTSSASASPSDYTLSPFLAWQWCFDLVQAADHLHYCSIALKWLGEDSLSVSTQGRLMITNLQGAELIETSIESLEQLKAQLLPSSGGGGDADEAEKGDDGKGHRHKSKHAKDDKQHRDREKDKDRDRDRERGKDKKHHHKHDRHHGEDDHDEDEDRDRRESKGAKDTKDKEKVSIPSNVLNFTAPEIIFGGEISHQSTVYVIGMIAAWILTGKHLIKLPSKEYFKVMCETT
jgi:hypothetical protein